MIKKIFFFFVVFTLLLGPFPAKTFAQSAGTETLPVLPLKDLAIDEEIGKVDERFSGSAGRTIIQIQDVHAHYDAQENIAAILERLRSVFGIKKVAVEGAWTATDLPKSHAIPTSREKQLLARTLMEDDLISGPAYAALLSPSPITLVGIEDAELYEKNRALFLEHLEQAETIKTKLSLYEEGLKKLEKETWNPDLFVFGRAFGKFREASDFEKFFIVLNKTAKERFADFSDLDQIVLVNHIRALERELDKKKLKAEIKKILRKYKNTPWNIEELIRSGKIPSEEIGAYPMIAKLSELLKLKDQLSIRKLMQQVETLTGRILWALIKTKQEEALWDQSERFYLAKRILLLEATPLDLEEAEKQKEALAVELQKVWLEEEWTLALDFYDAATKREKVFYEKLVTEPELSGSLAIVTGGFHTEGLSEQLREAGISYVTITPDLGETAPDKTLYTKRMLGTPSQDRVSTKERPGLSGAKTQTLSELQNALAEIDERFLTAYDVLRKTKNLRKAVDAFSGAVIPVLPSEEIAYMASKGKLRPADQRKLVTTSELHIEEFMEKPRARQREIVLDWIARGPESRVNAMLVSEVSIIKNLLPEMNSPDLVRRIGKAGDLLVLLEDVPPERIPELLWAPQRTDSPRRIELIRAPDLETMMQKNPRFKRFAKKHPFAIMKNDYRGGAYVVLPEHPASLILYRIVTLNPDLYRAAKNPEFLALLQGLVTEIISVQIAEKAA